MYLLNRGSAASSNLIKHETAPGGEEYALVPQKTSKPRPFSQDQPDSVYQVLTCA